VLRDGRPISLADESDAFSFDQLPQNIRDAGQEIHSDLKPETWNLKPELAARSSA
jgi:hypothetical protein